MAHPDGRPTRPRMAVRQCAFLAVAVAAGGYLGLLVAALTPVRFTAVELLLATPPSGRHQSVTETRYLSGVQRVVTDTIRARTELGVRMVVSPSLPLIEIDATAASSEAAVARAGAAATVAEQAWRQHAAGSDPRLVRLLPTAVSAQRTAPSYRVDGLVGAVLGAAAATVAAAARGGWPALPAPVLLIRRSGSGSRPRSGA